MFRIYIKNGSWYLRTKLFDSKTYQGKVIYDF